MLYVQELLEKNSAITTDLLSSTREGSQPADENALASTIRERSGASVNRAEVETLKQQLEIAQQDRKGVHSI
jgi:hypothetical protein